jgi:catechol 2,3-dioxygenase-like lactoylglutathione lyase family enzyme
MTLPRLEHVNITVSDADRAAALIGQIFGWQVRWQGPARDQGRAVHIGSEHQYLALYSPPGGASVETFAKGRPLNHIAVEVDDLDAIEEKVVEAGLTPFEHGDYEPGRRFYFYDRDGIEFEVVSYRQAVPALTA